VLPGGRDDHRRAVYAWRVASMALAALLFLAIGAGAYWSVRRSGPPPRAPIPAEQMPVTSSALAPSIPPASPAPRASLISIPLPLNLVEGAFSPTFASTGRELFFHAGRTNNGRLLVASLGDRGQPARVSTVIDEAGSNYHPRVSPDGQLIAFDSDRDGQRGVYVADRDGVEVQRVSGEGYAAVPSGRRT
jgi:hypothetical protein